MSLRIGINGFGRMGRLASSTTVVNGTCVKILAWYDNEIGCVNLLELAELVAPGAAT